MNVRRRASLTLGLWCCFASALSFGAEPLKESRPGVYRGYSPALYAESIKTSQYVAVRDGTRLAVDIYRPAIAGRAVEERFPVVWVHTPYRRAYRDASGKEMNAIAGNQLGELVKYGYVVAAVDTRGRGASFGARRGFQDRTEANDAYDMTEWFAKQPFSTGANGVAGCSYLGGTTWHSATTLAPHLRAIAPGCTDFDKYGFVSRGGITAQFNTRPEDPGQDFGQGVLPVDEDRDGKLAAQAIAAHSASTPMAELWRGMPYRDDVSPLLGVPFWREASVATYAKQIERSKVALFIWGNWLDEGSFEAVLAFNNLNNPRKLWMGTWQHCQVGDFPMSTELLRFFDRYLKNVDNGWDREPPIYYRTVNAAPDQAWSTAKQWPLPEAQSRALHLDSTSSTQLMLDAPSRESEARFEVNYQPKCKGAVNAGFMMWPCVAEKPGMSYTTAPLSKDTHIAGHPLADLWIASTQPDADLFVYLEDVSPSGEIAIVSHGRLRASFRSEQKPPFRNFMGLPYHRGNREDVKPLTPGERTHVRIDLLPTSTIVKSGHHLQLTISGADTRQRSRSVQFDPPPTISIFSGGKFTSTLSLPLVTDLALRASTQAHASDAVSAITAAEPHAKH
jgi:putative CocE/NonD family hydrolase